MFIIFFIGLVIYHIIKYIIPHFTECTPFVRRNSFWSDIEKAVQGRQVLNSNMYPIHKGPNRLRYITSSTDIKGILEDLAFILKYDKDMFYDIVIYTEYFLKFHLNVMLGKYDPCTYIEIIRDIYRSILNILSSCTFNIPKRSTIVDIPNLDDYMIQKTRDLQAVLSKHIYVLRHKYPRCKNDNVSPHDISFSEHMVY